MWPTPGPNVPVDRSGGGAQIVQTTLAATGEFGTNARTPIPDGGAAEFKYPFGSGAAGSEPTETSDEAFGIVPIDGEFRAIALYNGFGELDATEDLELTLRECAGGALTSCTWTDTAVTETAVGLAGTADTTWTTTGLSVAVTGGDVFTMKMLHPGTTGASVPVGSTETANYTLEFVGDNPNQSFLTATIRKNSGSGVFFPISGATDLHNTVAADVTTTMPGSFTLDLLRGSRDSTTGERFVALCDGDGGTDAACGSAGTEVARCTFADGSDTCATTGLSTALTTGSDLFYAYSQDFEAFGLTMGMGLTSASGEWVSVTCHGAHALADDSTEGGFGASGSTPGNFGYYCNQFTDPIGCEIYVISELVGRHMTGNAQAAPAGASESWTVVVAENGVDSTLDCEMGPSATTCSGTTDVTIEAGNTFMYRFTSVGTMDGVNGCWATLWGAP